MSAQPDAPANPLAALQAHFVAAVMPRVERHAEVYFRQHRRDPDKMEELTQASVALAWKWYLRLKLKGEKEPDDFVTTIATRACQHARIGRSINGQEKFSSVHNRTTQTRRGFRTDSLPEHDTSSTDTAALRAMQDDEASPADLAAYAIDTAAWLSHLDHRKRGMALDMMAGETTSGLADKYGVTAGAVSQTRRKLVEDYRRFVGTEPEVAH